MSVRVRSCVAVAAAIGATACTAGTASAAPSSTSFTCRGSTAIVNLAGQTALEPLVANGGVDASCATDGVGVPLNLQNALGAGTVSASAPTAFAQTALAGGGGPTASQQAASQAGVENLDLNLGGGALRVQAQAAIGSAGASCVDGSPAFPTFARVVGLTVNGTAVVGGTEASIPLSSGLGSVFDQLAGTPVAGLVKVQTEKVSVTGTPGGADEGRVVEAIHIDLLSAVGTPVATVVIGRAEAGRHGDVCTAPTTTPPGGGGGGNAGGGGGSGAGAGGTSTSTTTTTPGTDSSTSGSGNGSETKAPSTAKQTPNGTNGGGCARMTAFFDLPGGGVATSGPRTVRSRYGIRQVIRGRMVNCKGRPIVKARIEVVHYVHGTMKRTKTGLRTRGGGKFTLILPLNIRTRSVVLSYRGYLERKDVVAKKTLKVNVYNRRGTLLK